MGKKYTCLICFGVAFKKIFLRLLTEQNEFILKKLRYTRRPHTTKIHTLFKASGLKRHPVQDAQ